MSTSFESFNLHPRVAAGLKTAGYSTPTPIQQRAIPSVLEGRDVLGLAQTGTGKTAAFALPLLHRLQDGPRGRIRALIVAPTRELAEQINDEIRLLGKSTNLRSATVYGGVGMTPQIRALKGNAEVIVACPGRLLDHIERNNADLSKLEVLVLDEADHMFDMGFLPAIKSIVKRVPHGAQRLLFSATMPDALRQLAKSILNNPITVEIGQAAPAETVTHALYPVARHQKTAMLKHLLRAHDTRSALVFTRTKHGAKRLAAQLDKDNFFATSLQGNLSQNKRQKALDGFKRGDVHVLVATDIAARGIDVSRVSHVINYDIPDTPEAYTHRLGRTGRAERSGEAFTFVTPDDESAVRAIERSLGERIGRVTLDTFVYESAQENRTTSDESPPSRRKQAGRGGGRSNRPSRSESAKGRGVGGEGAGGQRSQRRRRKNVKKEG